MMGAFPAGGLFTGRSNERAAGSRECSAKMSTSVTRLQYVNGPVLEWDIVGTSRVAATRSVEF
jgi:hypothetical protein